MDAPRLPQEQQHPAHYLRANDFWNMRLEDGQSFDLFRRKVQRYECILKYNFNHIPEHRKIDMWIGRLPPQLVEKVRARTNDLFDLRSVEDLFAVLARIEAADSRVENAAKFWEPLPVDTRTPFWFTLALRRFSQEHPWFFEHAPQHQQDPIDLLLARCPPNALRKFRMRANNLAGIFTWKDVLERIEQIAEEDDQIFTDPEGYACRQQEIEEVFAPQREEIMKREKEAQRLIGEFEAEQAGRDWFANAFEKHVARPARQGVEGETLPGPNGSLNTGFNATRGRNSARNAARRNRRRQRRQD